MSASRLKVGIDVPWVTSWTGESFAGVRPCASVGGAAAVWQLDRPGEGRPQYSRNHAVRQRRSVAEMRCPMCGEPTPPEDRWTLTARRTTAGALRAGGLGSLAPPELADPIVLVNAGAIAPLHRGCADRSHLQCPHLSSDPTTELMAFPKLWKVFPLMVEARPAAGHLLSVRPAAPVAVVSFLQLVGITAERDRRWRAALRPRPSPAT